MSMLTLSYSQKRAAADAKVSAILARHTASHLAVTLAWIVEIIGCWLIWGAQVALCALALMVLAQTVITEFTAAPDDSR